MRAAAAAGQRHFGENRVQEGLDKIGATGDLQLEWHLIGHLQSNKAKKAASAFAWIHSIDSVELLRKVDSAAAEAGARPRVLIQVDLAHEATKFGADEATVGDIAKAALDAQAVDLRGLMIVPPIPEDPEESRAVVPAVCATCATRSSRAACRRRISAAPVDGHEPRLRGGDRRGRDDGPRRHGDLRPPGAGRIVGGHARPAPLPARASTFA